MNTNGVHSELYTAKLVQILGCYRRWFENQVTRKNQ